MERRPDPWDLGSDWRLFEQGEDLDREVECCVEVEAEPAVAENQRERREAFGTGLLAGGLAEQEPFETFEFCLAACEAAEPLLEAAHPRGRAAVRSRHNGAARLRRCGG